MKKLFGKLAKCISDKAGGPYAFILAALFIVAWALCGPIFKFSDTWQLVVNTTTTIVTFLMVFLIQNSQNRDTAALQIKLDELILVSKDAHNALLDLEELDENKLKKIRDKYEAYAKKARESDNLNNDEIPDPEDNNGDH